MVLNRPSGPSGAPDARASVVAALVHSLGSEMQDAFAEGERRGNQRCRQEHEPARGPETGRKRFRGQIKDAGRRFRFGM